MSETIIFNLTGQSVGKDLHPKSLWKHTTLASVNKAIKHMELELIKGEGYFYFRFTNPRKAHNLPSISVYRLNQLSKEQWITEAQNVVNNHYVVNGQLL